jgi:predicted ATPase
MARLKIKNIGPIKNGAQNDGFLDFDGVTFFTGPQGSGKSTIAKLYSTLSWIEKALVRGDFSPDFLASYKRFKKQFEYQGISEYFNPQSELVYIGTAYSIKYTNETLTITSHLEHTDSFFLPKIMYIPAERNFITTIDRPDLIKRLPMPLYTFLSEYENAKDTLKEKITLPIGNVQFEHKKHNKSSFLISNNYRIKLLQASSGFQSLIPLFIVTRYLSKSIQPDTEASLKKSKLSLDEVRKMKQKMDTIIHSKNSEDIKISMLEKLLNENQCTKFLNIVEEPEQNLYPSSQKNILWELLKENNTLPQNELVVTTHSPYLINYLTLAIKAFQISSVHLENPDIKRDISKVVPLQSITNPKHVHIYETNEAGEINELSTYKDLPSDENELNSSFDTINDSFIQLMDLE